MANVTEFQLKGYYFSSCSKFEVDYLVQIVNNSGNTSSHLFILDSSFDKNGFINAAFSILFFLVGLPWNALVIGIILKKKLFTRPTYLLLLNLAIANFLVCMLVLPFTIIFGLGGEDTFGSGVENQVCQVAVFYCTSICLLIQWHCCQ